MSTRSTMQIMSILACATLLAAPVLAGDVEPVGEGTHHVCTLDGAWWGSAPVGPEDFIYFTAVYNSENFWWGTLDLIWSGGPPSIFHPLAVALTDSKGQWRRTGHRTFEYTMIFYGLDATGLPVVINKMSGDLELVSGCEEMEITAFSEIYFNVDANPVVDDGDLCVDHGPAIGAMRMSIDPPCELPPP